MPPPTLYNAILATAQASGFPRLCCLSQKVSNLPCMQRTQKNAFFINTRNTVEHVLFQELTATPYKQNMKGESSLLTVKTNRSVRTIFPQFFAIVFLKLYDTFIACHTQKQNSSLVFPARGICTEANAIFMNGDFVLWERMFQVSVSYNFVNS